MNIRNALINDGTARHSERAIRLFSKALNCFVFDVRCLDDRSGECTFSERGISIDAIARVVPKLRHKNANGSSVLVRPCLSFAFADDVSTGTLERMLDDDLRIAAAIETSPQSFQIWVPLAGSLQTIDEFVCAAACERLVELYGTDYGVAHRDSFGRAPGFRNRKPEHGDHDGTSPLVKMANRHCGFRGYDRTLLGEAYRLVADRSEPLVERSVGAVLNANDQSTSANTNDYLGPIKVRQGGCHVVTFSAISADRLFESWLFEMRATGYEAPQRADCSGADRSQRDLDVLRSMHMAGVSRDTAEAALEAGSDKAQERGSPYVQHLMRAVWEAPRDIPPGNGLKPKCGIFPHENVAQNID